MASVTNERALTEMDDTIFGFAGLASQPQQTLRFARALRDSSYELQRQKSCHLMAIAIVARCRRPGNFTHITHTNTHSQPAIIMCAHIIIILRSHRRLLFH